MASDEVPLGGAQPIAVGEGLLREPRFLRGQRGVALPTYGNKPLPVACGFIHHPPAMKHEATSLESSFNLERDAGAGSLDFLLRQPVPVLIIDILLRVE